MDKEKDSFYEKQHQYNIAQKEMFHNWLQDAIKNNKRTLFSEIVKFIGREWSVLRTVEKGKLDEFCNNLWKNREKIQKGTYEWNNSKYKAYSYESKICFLINPEYYKFIYDGNVRKALNKATKDNWQEKAEEYYQNNNNKEKNPFEVDWTLWLEGYLKH